MPTSCNAKPQRGVTMVLEVSSVPLGRAEMAGYHCLMPTASISRTALKIKDSKNVEPSPLKKQLYIIHYQLYIIRFINYTLSALWRCEVLVKFLLVFETQWVWCNILIFRMLCSFLLGFACFSRKTLYRPPLKNFFFGKKMQNLTWRVLIG